LALKKERNQPRTGEEGGVGTALALPKGAEKKLKIGEVFRGGGAWRNSENGGKGAGEAANLESFDHLLQKVGRRSVFRGEGEFRELPFRDIE